MQNQQPINTTPIKEFINQVKSAESSQQQEIRLDIAKAKKLHFCLTELLARHVEDLESLLIKKVDEQQNPTINVQMDGGNSW